MREKKERPEKKPKAARPVSAHSVLSTQSSFSIRSKMTASWRDPNKEIVKSGWLYKQDSTGKMKMWRKKWFVLADFCLYYYKDSKEEEILGSIILPSYTVSTLTAEDKINRKYAFKVEHAGMKTYYVSADSYNDMALWITALQKSCHAMSLNIDKPKEVKPESEPEKESEDNNEEDDSKGNDGTKGKKKDSLKTKDDDDSEFGFNHVRVHPARSTTSSQSTEKGSQRGKSPSANVTSNNNIKNDPHAPERNGRLPAYQPSRSPKHQERPPWPQDLTPRRAQETYPTAVPIPQRIPSAKQELRQTGRGSRHNRSAQRQDPNVPHLRQGQPPQQKSARRENGESAYFSDTSGATDSSRFANSSERSNAQRGQQAPTSPQNKVKRQDSLVKLGNWVINQKMRQSGTALNFPQRTDPPSNFDTASEFSSVSQQHTRKSATLSARGPQKMGPPSSRRYRARTYNEYMDPMEVASSTISMPPMQHVGHRMQVAHTMPRPQSTENVDKMGRPIRKSDPGQRMVSSKSAGNIVAVDQYGAPISPRQIQHGRNLDNTKRAKSDYVFQNGDNLQQQYIANFRKAQVKENQGFRAPRQQHRPQSAGRSSNSSSGGGLTPRRAHYTPKSAGVHSDVFSPRSEVSSARSNKSPGQVFRFDPPQNHQIPRGNVPTTLAAPPRTSDSGFEVKQIQRGQFRAFAVSTRSPQTQLPPPERQTPLKSSENIAKLTTNFAKERDIESKLKKLNDSERAFQQISDDMANLQADKERLEADLSIVRSKLQYRYSAGSRDDGRQVDTQQHKLEQELGNVKAQLANAAQKLKEMHRDNESFDYEIRTLKNNIVEELRNHRSITDDVYNGRSSHDKEGKRKLEWELGRIEFIIEGLKKQKTLLSSKLHELHRNREDDSPLNSPTSPPSMLSGNGRSPRDIKRTSMERRTTPNRPSYSSTSSSGTPNSTPVKKYFTLPGRGVPHATSVDSVTADSLAKSSSRPTSARSVSSIGSSTGNLHRTKSASERLFNSQYGNQGSDHEAKEIKRLQKEIFRNRRNNLKSGSVGDAPRRYSNPTGMTLPARSHMKVGIDVQMALKHHRMPKVLKRAKRDRAEAINHQSGFDIDDLDRKVNTESGLYSNESYTYDQDDDEKLESPRQIVDDDQEEEIHVDVNLTHQTTSVVTSSTFSSGIGSGGGFSSTRRSFARVSPPKATRGRPEGEQREASDGRVFVGGGGPGIGTIAPDSGSRIHNSVYRMII